MLQRAHDSLTPLPPSVFEDGSGYPRWGWMSLGSRALGTAPGVFVPGPSPSWRHYAHAPKIEWPGSGLMADNKFLLGSLALQGVQDHSGLNTAEYISSWDSFTRLSAVWALKQKLFGSGRKGNIILKERSCRETSLSSRSHRHCPYSILFPQHPQNTEHRCFGCSWTQRHAWLCASPQKQPPTPHPPHDTLAASRKLNAKIMHCNLWLLCLRTPSWRGAEGRSHCLHGNHHFDLGRN